MLCDPDLMSENQDLGFPSAGFEHRTFVVGVDTLAGTRGGHLEIAPGSLVCRLGRSWGAGQSGPDMVVHKGNEIDVYLARAPFWSNVGTVVSDGQWTVVAVLGASQRHGFLAALRDAGFAVEQHRTWFDTGKGTMRRP